MNYESIFEPILLEIKTEKKDLNFRFKTSEKFREFKFNNSKLQEENDKLYNKLKALKPFNEYDFPYYNFRNFTKNFNFGYSKGQHYYNTKFSELNIMKDRYVGIADYHNVSGAISFHDTEFFERFISYKKVYNVAFFSLSLLLSGVENFLNYREKNSHLSYNDNILYFELPFYITKQYKATPEEIRNKFKKTYKNVSYHLIENNICCETGLENISQKIESKLDLIVFDTVIFYYPLKKYSSYLSCQVIFNMILLSFKKLKKKGIMKFKIREIDNYLIVEILTIVCKYFENVYIFKSSLTTETNVHKEIICDKFLGVDDSIISKMNVTSEKWLEINKSCGMDFTKNKDIFVYSIVNHDKDILYYLNKLKKSELTKSTIGFEKAINAYYYVKENGEDAIKQLYLIQLKNSIEWMRLHNLDVISQYKIIDEKIFKEDKPITISFILNNLQYLITSGKNTKKDVEHYYKKMAFFNYLENLTKLMNKKIFSSVSNSVKKISIKKEERFSEIMKLFSIEDNDYFISLDLSKEKSIEDIEILFNKYEKSYLYKSPLTMDDLTIFFVGKNLLPKPTNKKCKIFKFIISIIELVIEELERNIFYYENRIIFKDNKNHISNIQRKNNKIWKNYFK